MMLIRYFRKQTCCPQFVCSQWFVAEFSFTTFLPVLMRLSSKAIYFLTAFNCHLISKTLFTHDCWAATKNHLFLVNTVQCVRSVIMCLARRMEQRNAQIQNYIPFILLALFLVWLLCHFASRFLFPSVVTLVSYCYSFCRQHIWNSSFHNFLP